MSFEQVKARHRLAWGLDVASYQKHTTIELVPVAEKLVEIADPAWDSSLIDIGCGPGTATFPAAKRVGPGGRDHRRGKINTQDTTAGTHAFRQRERGRTRPAPDVDRG